MTQAGHAQLVQEGTCLPRGEGGWQGLFQTQAASHFMALTSALSPRSQFSHDTQAYQC